MSLFRLLPHLTNPVVRVHWIAGIPRFLSSEHAVWMVFWCSGGEIYLVCLWRNGLRGASFKEMFRLCAYLQSTNFQTLG